MPSLILFALVEIPAWNSVLGTTSVVTVKQILFVNCCLFLLFGKYHLELHCV